MSDLAMGPNLICKLADNSLSLSIIPLKRACLFSLADMSGGRRCSSWSIIMATISSPVSSRWLSKTLLYSSCLKNYTSSTRLFKPSACIHWANESMNLSPPGPHLLTKSRLLVLFWLALPPPPLLFPLAMLDWKREKMKNTNFRCFNHLFIYGFTCFFTRPLWAKAVCNNILFCMYVWGMVRLPFLM